MLYNGMHFNVAKNEPLYPQVGSKPGNHVYAKGYDKLGGM